MVPAADQDLYEILTWIHVRSPWGAATWLDRWEQALKQLESSAPRHGRAPEDEDHHIDIYQLLLKTRRGLTYRALYTISGSQVTVLRIRGPGQELLAPDDIDLSFSE